MNIQCLLHIIDFDFERRESWSSGLHWLHGLHHGLDWLIVWFDIRRRDYSLDSTCNDFNVGKTRHGCLFVTVTGARLILLPVLVRAAYVTKGDHHVLHIFCHVLQIVLAVVLGHYHLAAFLHQRGGVARKLAIFFMKFCFGFEYLLCVD